MCGLESSLCPCYIFNLAVFVDVVVVVVELMVLLRSGSGTWRHARARLGSPFKLKSVLGRCHFGILFPATLPLDT
jgi:hypothetical protein